MRREPNFAVDLYRGTAEYYDRFRPGYPPVLTDDLLSRVRPSGRGRLLDLACGTGQLAFALHDSFAQTCAVDQEPDMVSVVAAKAARGAHDIRAIVSSAEGLSAEPASFELITIGNAFHRLRREQVAGRTLEWLGPSGHLALCWSTSPWAGQADWQKTLNAVLDLWRSELNARERVPQDWDHNRRIKPDLVVLVEAGFEPVGRYEFQVEQRWTVADLAGLAYSTSFLAAGIFGDRAREFEADMANRLEPHLHHGVLVDQASFAYDLVRKPALERD
jgi:SAM-dependent methyltransferase